MTRVLQPGMDRVDRMMPDLMGDLILRGMAAVRTFYDAQSNQVQQEVVKL